MRRWFCFLLFFGFCFSVGSTFGQVVDSIQLTGTMADTVVANALLKEAIDLIRNGKYDEAFERADSAEHIFTHILGMGVEARGLADAFHQKGRTLFYTGKYDGSIDYLKKALTIRLRTLGSEHPDVATSYNSLGVAYNGKGEFDKAIDCCTKGLNIRLKVLGKEHPDVAISYNCLALVYTDKGEFDKAIESVQNIFDIRLKVLGPDHPQMSTYYNTLGRIYNNKGEYDKAIDFYKNALRVQLNSLGPDHPDIAVTYNNFGVSYADKGEYDKSIEFNRKSLDLRLKILGPEHPYVADSYLSLGSSYGYKGDYDKAIELHQKSLEIFLKVLGPEHSRAGVAYNNLGSTYNDKGEYNKAIDLFQKSLDIWLKSLGPESPALATSYHNLGNAYIGKGEYDKAIDFHQKSLEIFLKTLTPEHAKVAMAYSYLGNAYYGNREYDKAILSYQKSFEIRLKSLGSEHPDVAESYNNLGNTYERRVDYQNALNAYDNARKACRFRDQKFQDVNSMEQLLYSVKATSRIFKKEFTQTKTLSLLSKSLYFAQQGLKGLDYQQSTFTEEGIKSLWQSKNYSIYEQVIDITLLKANVDRNNTLRQAAFTYSEKSKASLLQTQIKESIAFSGLPDSLLQQEHILRIDLTYREKQRQALLYKGLSETDTNALRISSIIFDLPRQYEALKDTLESRYPEYYRLKYDRSTGSLPYIQDTLLQPGQSLLEYFTGDSAVYIFVVRPDTFSVVEVKKDFPLEDWVKHLRHGLTDYYAKNSRSATYMDSTAREYVQAAYDLYQKLIKPVEGLLDSTLIIVPDGVLGYVPFDVLLSEKPANPTRFHSHKYLGQQRRISYDYSATLLRDMRDKRHKTPPTENLLALAPFFRGDVAQLSEQVDTLSDLLSLRRDTLSALPASGREALVVAKIYDGKALLGGASPKEILQQEAGHYRILHLSTHGKADDKVGDYAFLGFAMPGDSLAFDKLYAKDIYNLALNADLVTLSACETGIGELKRGEGIISLARAFAYAGAKSIVTTLWSVNDARTGELMERFYKNLHAGMNKDAALWQAKKDFIAAHKKDAAHPYFWAGFIPIGDMRAIKQ